MVVFVSMGINPLTLWVHVVLRFEVVRSSCMRIAMVQNYPMCCRKRGVINIVTDHTRI